MTTFHRTHAELLGLEEYYQRWIQEGGIGGTDPPPRLVCYTILMRMFQFQRADP